MKSRELLIPLKNSLNKAIKVIWLLTKIIVPISILMALLDYYHILAYLANLFTPIMSLVGLPGEAAIALVMGYGLNTFAALGVIASLSLSTTEITVLAVMLGISHELPVESAVCTHTGLRMPVSILLRISTSLMVGILLNAVLRLFGGL